MTTLATITSLVRTAIKDSNGEQVDSCDVDWSDGTGVSALDTTNEIEGTGCISVTLNSDSGSVQAYKNFSSPKNLSMYKRLVFYIRTNDTATAGQLELRLCSAQGGAGALESLDVPAMATADTWYRFAVKFSDPTQLTHVMSIALANTADLGADVIKVDDVRAEHSTTRWTDSGIETQIGRALQDMELELPRRRTTFVESRVSVHQVDDAANVTTAAAATSLATAGTLLDNIKDKYEAHRASTTHHRNDDDVNTLAAAQTALSLTWSAAAATAANVANNLILLRYMYQPHLTAVDAAGLDVHYAPDFLNESREDVANSDTDSDGELIGKVNELHKLYDQHIQEDSSGTYINTTALTSLIAVNQVEYPVGWAKPNNVSFEPYGANGIIMTGRYNPTVNGEQIKLSWSSRHTLDSTTSTLSTETEKLLVYLCSAYCLWEYSSFTANKPNPGDVSKFSSEGDKYYTLYMDGVKRIQRRTPSKRGRVSTNRYSVR